MKVTGTEVLWAAATAGRPYRGPLAKLTPNHTQYPRPSSRRVSRHGFNLDLDISDLIDWYLYFGFEDPSHTHLLALCEPGQVAFDVGANIGLTTLSMARALGPHGKVYAFEPDRDTHGRLERHLRLNGATNVDHFLEGVGEKVGELTMSVGDERNRGMNRIDPSGTRPVRITTLDEFTSAHGLSRVDLIKIDIEGFEAAALRGAQNVLKKFRPTLFLELDDTLLSQQGSSAADLLQFLDTAGYDIREATTGDKVVNTTSIHIDVVGRPK